MALFPDLLIDSYIAFGPLLTKQHLIALIWSGYCFTLWDPRFLHGCYAINCPITNVSVKGRGSVEHEAHVGDAGGVPRADVLVEGRRGRVAVTAPTI